MQVVDAFGVELQLEFVSNLLEAVFPVHICFIVFLKIVLFLLIKS